MMKLIKRVLIFSYLAACYLSVHTAMAETLIIPKDAASNEKQEMNKSAGAQPETLDPQKTMSVNAAHIVNDLFEGLLTEKPDATGSISPGIASSWEISPDGKTYTFHLRHDAKWSNGKPLTAQDFVYGFQRGLDPTMATPYGYILYDIKNAKAINTGKEKSLDTLGVKAINDHTLQIELTHSVPYFLNMLASATVAFPAYKPSIVKWGKAHTRAGHLVSNGAYRLIEANINSKIVLEKNPYYWDAKHVIIQKVNYYPIVRRATALNMYENGQLDFTYEIPSDQYKHLKKKYNARVHITSYLGVYYYSLNVRPNSVFAYQDDSKHKNKKTLQLRQALSMTVNRQALVKQILGMGNLALYKPVPYGTTEINDVTYPWTKLKYTDRITKARALFKAAGYGPEHPLNITFTYNTNADHKKVGIAVTSMWKSAFGKGLQVNLKNEEWKVFLEDRRTGNYQGVARDGWIADYNHPSSFLTLWSCDSVQNNPGYCNPTYDALLTQAGNTQDTNKRQQLYTQAETILMNDYILIPLYQYVNSHLVKAYVGHYRQGNPLDHVYTKNWYIKKH